MPLTSRIDAGAFTDWVRRFGPELRLYSLKLTGGRAALADEILQSAYQVAWTRREDFKGGNVRAWLYCITRQQGLYRLRSEGRYVEIAPERLRRLAERPLREDGPPDPERLAALRGCFGCLAPVDKAIVQMAYGLSQGPEAVEGERRPTYEEIGRALGPELGGPMSPDGVRMRLKRALARLLRCMSEREGRPS